ncbi:MAG TPA: NAD(P)H-binding protein [Candidatus Acidoferrales bacterium]|nr:NAD(P)H-binding protein [Candidatus Acidoferrales bacterium]
MGSIRDGFHVVTGAFGYTGKYIAQRLLAEGHNVKTLTNHPGRANPFGNQVAVSPLDFDHPESLAHAMVGAKVLYNTYWVRFQHGETTFAQAIANTEKLVRAAENAGVRRIVHVSIANPSLDSPLPYYCGKAEMEEAIRASKLSYAILRPTVVFGTGGILINNIAWLLRHFPIFAVPGHGDYKLQPIFVEDMADLAVAAGETNEDVILDAVGPEVFTFDELVRLIAVHIGGQARLIHVPSEISLLITRMFGVAMHDVILTREEIKGLMANLLVSGSAPTGTTRLSDWLKKYGAQVGTHYASELGLHYR